ncbi:YjiH family protein [Candidatus Enterovibrio escicola]|uniref:Putative arginine uptake transporter n=1 Tax=Candidatus Enterovibrio escicola TaxID=1927127 RepID=A0A2A5T3N4_9GAMM|nr:YjiH family protein [Candidatus Enterovibrio escacola]PCS22764.1 putative arginine uptake transporter [Candidatus Enterovibrio escacola]
MQNTLNMIIASSSTRNVLMFFIPSLLGIFLFITPVMINGGFTIPITILAKTLLNVLGEHTAVVVTTIIVFSAMGSVFAHTSKPGFITQSSFLKDLFLATPIWMTVRLLGAAFVLMVFFGFGPEYVISASTGSFVLGNLLPTLLSVFVFSGLFLPLLTNFGLLELIGTLMTRIMRPLFRLPGRSAVDCVSSWFGDGSVAILMSSKQYEQGYYTEREAAIVGTTFSVVSISFSLVVIAQVGLQHMFVQFYLTVCLAGIVAAVIVPRLPPLCWKKDTLITGEERPREHEALPNGESLFSHGLKTAIERASRVRSLRDVLKEGLKNVVDMVFGVLPVVMTIGTIALIISQYTTVLTILGMPFIPLLELLKIPETVAASETMLVGIADMFIPAVLAVNIDNEMTRFVVATVSVTQLIYMSEVGALLLGSKIPVKLWELVMVFILRTLVTLPVIASIAHLIF